ncbi:MAG: DUF4926 domain-containing protein [Gammaproteobacteria bacterium]
MSINLLDPVVLNEDLPVHGLKRGDIGAVVEIYSTEDFEVEFVTGAGHTQRSSLFTLIKFAQIGPQDIPAVRQPRPPHSQVRPNQPMERIPPRSALAP